MLEACFIDRTKDALANEALVKRLFALWRLDSVLRGIEDVTVRVAGIRDERTSILLLSGGWTLAGRTRPWQNPRGGQARRQRFAMADFARVVKATARRPKRHATPSCCGWRP